MMDLLCKMLDPSKADGTRGRHSLARRVEEFAYSMLTGRGCPAPIDDGLYVVCVCVCVCMRVCVCVCVCVCV